MRSNKHNNLICVNNSWVIIINTREWKISNIQGWCAGNTKRKKDQNMKEKKEKRKDTCNKTNRICFIILIQWNDIKYTGSDVLWQHKRISKHEKIKELSFDQNQKLWEKWTFIKHHKLYYLVRNHQLIQ